MEFGVQMNGRTFQKLRDYVREAEDLGYSAMFMPDHFVYDNPGGFDPEQPVFEALTTLAGLAEATSRIKLGTHVLCTLFRHPTITAKMLTTIDHISEGRLIAGFGAGWTKVEFDMMGYDYPDISTRLRIMEETMLVVRALWTEERANFDGEFFHLTDAVCSPKPVQRPHPPIFLGGNGNGIMRRAGKYADIVNIVVGLGKKGEMDLSEIPKLTSDAIKKKIAVVREEQEKAGRPADAVKISTSVFQFVVTDSSDTTQSILDNFSGMYGIEADVLRHVPLVLIGTKEEIAEEIAWREREWNLGQIILNANNSHEMRTFGTEVVASLR